MNYKIIGKILLKNKIKISIYFMIFLLKIKMKIFHFLNSKIFNAIMIMKKFKHNLFYKKKKIKNNLYKTINKF